MRAIQRLLLAVSIFATSPSLVAGQAADSTVRKAIASVRERGFASSAAEALAGERGSTSVRDRDALADSLVVIGTAFGENGSPAEQRAAMAAITALASSAGPDRATPYPRAFEALVRIYEGAPEGGIGAATLFMISELPSVGRAVEFLADVAVSPEGHALAAIRLLAERMGPPGLDKLKELHESNAVVQPGARQSLGRIAKHLGWQP